MKSLISFAAFIVFCILAVRAVQMGEGTIGMVFGGLALISGAVWHGPLTSGGGRKRSRGKGRANTAGFNSLFSQD